MTDPEDLEKRIEAAKQAQKPVEPAESATGTASNAAAALGHSAGLVVAMAVGGLIGYFIDTVAGSAPFALLIFLVFGAIAGLLNIIRAGQQMTERAREQQGADKATD